MRSITRAAVVALALTALAGVAHAQGMKVGYVNTQALMEVAPGRAAADSALQREQNALGAQFKKLQDSLQAMYATYQKKEPTLSTTQKDAEQKKITTFETELQAKQLQFQQQIAQKQQDLYAPVTEKVKLVLEEVGKELGLSMIFQNDPGQSPIVWADKNLDVTDKVVTRLRTVAATERTNAKPGATGPTGVVKPPKPPTQ